MRRCAPTWPRALPADRGRRPVRVHARVPAVGGAGLPRRGPGVLRLRQARPEDRAGQGRRPAADHRAARRRALDRRDRRGAGRRGHPAEPHRDRRGDRRGGAAPAVAPPRRRPRRPRRGRSRPAPRPLDFAALPGAGRDPAGRAAAGHPGPDRPGPPATWRPPPATRPRRGSPPCPTCCRCWRSS